MALFSGQFKTKPRSNRRATDFHRGVLVNVLFLFLTCQAAFAQSGASGIKSSGREYAVNLTYAVYQYDAGRSSPIEDVTRLSGTFSSAQEEIAYLKEKNKLQEIAVRHIRSVGLRSGESFNDAVLLGPEYMVLRSLLVT
jgi:hypothetical protein